MNKQTADLVWDFVSRTLGDDGPPRGEVEQLLGELLLRVVQRNKPGVDHGTGNGLVVDAIASALGAFYEHDEVAAVIAEMEAEAKEDAEDGL